MKIYTDDPRVKYAQTTVAPERTNQEIDCPECGETTTLVHNRKEFYYVCSKHGRLSDDYQTLDNKNITESKKDA